MPDAASVPSAIDVPVAATLPAKDAAFTPFAWTGSPWRLAGIAALNAMLTLLTIGVYGFWGRTEMRRRMWSSVRLLGEPFVYHGTGRELLRGFLSVLAIVLLPLSFLGLVLVIWYGGTSKLVYQMGLFLVVYPILIAVASYRARRYRLSRTSWRGIRGSMDGSSGEFAFWSWMTAAGVPVTLGWITPLRAVTLQRMLVDDTQLGAEPMRFVGGSRPLYLRYALLWFGTMILFFGMFFAIGEALGRSLDPANPFWWVAMRPSDWAVIVGVLIATVVTWSIISSYYYARLYSHLASCTWLGLPGGTGLQPVRFALDVKGHQLIWLYVTNSLITYLSLFVLRPVATARSMKFYAENLRIVGAFEPARLMQSLAFNQPETGEGLAQAFDLDAF